MLPPDQDPKLAGPAARFEEQPPLPAAPATLLSQEPPFPPVAPPASPLEPSLGRGMQSWLFLVLIFGVGGLLLGQYELALFAALAGLFATAQAADRDPRWSHAYMMLAWVVPVGAVATFTGVALIALREGVDSIAGVVAVGVAAAAAIISGLTWLHPIGMALAATLFRTADTTHTLRLAARLVLIGLLFAWPGWWLFSTQSEILLAQDTSLLGYGSLSSGLIGLCLLAVGGVGFLVRRPLPATLARLGLRAPRASDLALVAGGVVVLFLFNAAAERLQQSYFPDQYQADQYVTRLIAGRLSRSETLLLGVSAGIGEEIALRGALQPRLGLLMTSILFGAVHVQYSWYGMAVILVLGLVLGWIRRRASTTTAMMVHGLYDVLAVLAMQPAA
jgi:CAAX prenyl protease-like protein